MSSSMTLIGLSLTLAWPGVVHARNAEVPPAATRPESPTTTPRAGAEDSTRRIVVLSRQVDDSSRPGAPQILTFRMSADPATGQSEIFTKPVTQSYKRIWFRVAPSVQGQVGTIVRQLTPAATTLVARPDSLALQAGLRSRYAEEIRTRGTGNALARNTGPRFVAAEYPVTAGGTACVDLPFDSGEVEVTWFMYGSPNPEALRDLPVRRADGSMPFRLVRYRPLFLGTDPDQIESSAKVIHTAVVNLDQGVVIGEREL
jgi:hypothetical protein